MKYVIRESRSSNKTPTRHLDSLQGKMCMLLIILYLNIESATLLIPSWYQILPKSTRIRGLNLQHDPYHQ